ncbi:cytochrome b/b6 domain-containing protein [Endozoicomonas sp. 4G]|uniref:cytochrome b n=1 Tax=Endozoicomonas sp. 4G TaxID=2872754 RepID=UPI002078733D|nr:cytochrome b/b6 domain-containing protein [Endozoicomonas sp. 4G]
MNRYHPASVLLHWFSAVIILWATISGFLVAFTALPSHIEGMIGYFNVAITAIFVPFFILRVMVRLVKGKPKNETDSLPAEIGHFLLYTNIAIVLVTGLLMMERPIDLFGLLSLGPFISSEEVTGIFHSIHRVTCMTLAALVFGHIGAVVVHHLRKKPVIKAMTFGA